MYLNCHTYFSLKYGTLSIQKLIQEAKKNEIDSLCLTDINTTSAVLDFVRVAHIHNINPKVGVEIRNGDELKYILLAQNNEGYYHINCFLSQHLHDETPFPDYPPTLPNVFIVYPFNPSKKDYRLNENEWVGIKQSELIKLLNHPLMDSPRKLVALQPVTFSNKNDHNTHRLLRAIDHNTLLSQLPKSSFTTPDEIMLQKKEVYENFLGYEFLIKNAETLLSLCNIYFTFNDIDNHNNQKSYTLSEELDFKLLKKLVYQNLPYRYENITDEIFDRIDKELKIIQQKKFVSYFLIAWKILKYARSKNYFYVGRGSGANSILSYLLRITDVDPIELDLYFERFINLFRQNPPDFDIDFSWQEREDVTKFIFDYFPNVALLATYNTFQFKGCIRELGKVFGLPEHEIKKLQYNPDEADEIGQLVLKYSKRIHGFPNHLSVHAGGILISDKPLQHYSATFMPPKGFPTVQFDMHAAEDIGLYKFDILGQRGLAKVKDTLSIVKSNTGNTIDIHNISKLKKDKKTNALLKDANAIGCFYVESPAMRMLLKKLQVNDYLGLVAASSVIRPGVAQSGMMREYILRYRHPAKREWAKKNLSVLYNIMPDTFGVMVYQEDVIKVAHYFAGLTLAEADVLRRGMSGKFRSREEFQEVKNKFFINCKNKNYPDELTQDVWRQIESFAGYAFAKGHSASYAVESYQCLYLKAYYPLEFMLAVLNNGGGFYSRQFYIHEAKMCGATVQLPCINISDYHFSINDKTIYIGLGAIKSLEINTAKNILHERNTYGHFKSLRDFVNRVAISLEQLTILIRSGCFHFESYDKKKLLWDAHFLMGEEGKSKPTKGLFDIIPKKVELPDLWRHPLEDAYDEIELFGFTVSTNMFALFKDLPEQTLTAIELQNLVGKHIAIVGYLVHLKSTTTKDGLYMSFGTFIDINGSWIDSVHFPSVAERYPYRGAGCYQINGKVVEEFGYISIEVSKMIRYENINIEEEKLPVRSVNTYHKRKKGNSYFSQRKRLE